MSAAKREPVAYVVRYWVRDGEVKGHPGSMSFRIGLSCRAKNMRAVVRRIGQCEKEGADYVDVQPIYADDGVTL